jgi:hypothetical protein
MASIQNFAPSSCLAISDVELYATLAEIGVQCWRRALFRLESSEGGATNLGGGRCERIAGLRCISDCLL